jgi:excisionase family DNA binding protein
MRLEHSPTQPAALGKISHTLPQAAAATGLSRSSIYKWIKRGRILAKKADGRTLIEDAELRRFVASLPNLEPRSAA